MMCSGAMHLPVARILAEDFHVILPTYDGRCLDGSHYTSAPDQCTKICAYLDDKGIDDIILAQGSSIGAEIALELLRELPRIRNAFFDGGPFFRFLRPVRRGFSRLFMDIVEKDRGFPSDEEAIEGFASSEKIRSKIPLSDAAADETNADEAVRGFLADFVPIARSMDRRTVENLGETCYSGILPAFGEDVQRRMTFYCGKETAGGAQARAESLPARKLPAGDHGTLHPRDHAPTGIRDDARLGVPM